MGSESKHEVGSGCESLQWWRRRLLMGLKSCVKVGCGKEEEKEEFILINVVARGMGA
jgi:hypothetical protein